MTAVAKPEWIPTKVLIVDVEDGYGPIRPEGPEGLTFLHAWVLVRRRGTPLGLATVVLDGVVPAEEVERAAVAQLGSLAAAQDVAAPVQPEGQAADGGLLVPDGAALPAITVVVCSTFERLPELQECIATLVATDYPALRILVVDNRADPDLAQHASLQALGPTVEVIVERRPGLSFARNTGLAACTTALVAFTDDDVHVDRRWLTALASTFQAHPEAACVTGLVIPHDLTSKPQHLFEAFYGGFNRTFTPAVYGPGHGTDDPLHPYAVGRYGTGANMAFRTAALRDLGGFDEALGAGTLAKGGEDLAAFLAVVVAGGTLVVQPAAITRHTHRATDEELAQRVQSYGAGLTAMLTALVVGRPRHALAMARRVPIAVRSVVASRSGTVASHDLDVQIPAHLYARQVLGMALGPASYVRSRRDVRRRRHHGVPAG